MKIFLNLMVLFLLAGLMIPACKKGTPNAELRMQDTIQDPMDWVKKANIY